MSEHRTIADRYRQEAIEIRRAAQAIRDERFRHQLLAIADEYEAAATEIEAQLAGGSQQSAGKAVPDQHEHTHQHRRKYPID
jgi:hypothetical protein